MTNINRCRARVHYYRCVYDAPAAMRSTLQHATVTGSTLKLVLNCLVRHSGQETTQAACGCKGCWTIDCRGLASHAPVGSLKTMCYPGSSHPVSQSVNVAQSV